MQPTVLQSRLNLPTHLGERCRVLSERPISGEFVLYWVRGAIRGTENPALDTAIHAANALALPIFVHQALSERYPWASDRHHRFMLEGAVDLAHQCAQRGLGYALHVERPGHRGAHTVALADRAAVVVTEDLPIRFLQRWADRLAQRSQTSVICVDTACVVPMNVVLGQHTRAFAFRQAIAPELESRLRAPWVDATVTGPPFVPDDLPYEPVDLTAPLAPLIARCDIDHSVGPATHTRGGSAAGYARWNAFRGDGGLARYGRDRNDPSRHGVSRMSPYLHHGMVAPTRLAREAALTPGKGAEKYLDELVVWRELAWNFCRDRPEHDTLAALPEWALETLRQHEGDEREMLPDRERLSRGRTGSALWDASQRSLLQHGELHNNVRMTWGKALVGWTSGPERALDTLVDLNHRYALDGRDPASFGGLLWCMGGFDRPFSPEQPVLGTVRPRDLAAHERRIDLPAYQAHVRRPLHRAPPRVAVVGGGVAGAICARTLADHGVEVVVFDKARGAGGRLSTRRADAHRFDHGCPSLGAMPTCIQRYADAWVESGLLAVWPGPFVKLTEGGAEVLPGVRRYVPVPSMNALPKHLLSDLTVRFGTRITALERVGTQVEIRSEDDVVATFDHVLVCAPAPQAAHLLSAAAPVLADRLARVTYVPSWVAMASLSAPLGVDWSAAQPTSEPALRLIVRNQSKPGRPPGEQIVLHGSDAWSEAHLEDDAEQVATALWAAAAPLLGGAEPTTVTAHRWRYSRIRQALDVPCLLTDDGVVGVAGDGVAGDGVGAALASGVALAGRLLGHLHQIEPQLSPSQLDLLGGAAP